MESYSQLGQDLQVLQYYNNKVGGYFIEVGASDGVKYSNTFVLEKNFGWRGICVEPLPEKFKELCKNRPFSICCDSPLYDVSGQVVTFDVAHQDDMLSGINMDIDCHKGTVDSSKHSITLTTITLNELLESCNAPTYIDYMSLDTEGSELKILSSFDFNKYKIGLIDVEHNYIEPRRTKIRELLTSNGYIYLRANMFDDSYALKKN